MCLVAICICLGIVGTAAGSDCPSNQCKAEPVSASALLQAASAIRKTASGRVLRPCTGSLTSRCCGDGVCDGPETVANCGADCDTSPISTPAPAPPSGGAHPPPTAGECTTVPVEKPTVPTECTPENQGCCDCGTMNVKTFVFWVDGGRTQRCFHATNFPSSTPAADPMPVVLHMDGYSGGKKPSEFAGGEDIVAAKYYGFVLLTLGNLLKDGAGGFGLEFGNDGVANDDNPTPCSESDSREIVYLKEIFGFIASNPKLMDASRVYTEGFSQNSAFSVYAAVCFADKVAGVLQSGSGIVRTGWFPVPPGFQGQCSFDSYALHGDACCGDDFCSECQYWPLWPQTCNNKIFDCIFAYTDDTIACGGDWHAYQAMVHEGNDARLLSFPVPDGDERAGHRDPRNKWAWFAGCAGMAPTCSSACATAFEACIASATDAKTYERFAACEDRLKAGELSGCTVGCAPTLSMLMTSERPTVTLSQGKFGLETGQAAATGDAPKPACKSGPSPIGPTDRSKCYPPSAWVEKPIAPKDVC